MRKIWVIAAREYKMAVRSKAFIVTLVLMPVFMGGSIGAQAFFRRLDDNKQKHYAVVDRSGGDLARVLQADVERFNLALTHEPEERRRLNSKIALVIIAPSASEPEAIEAQRYELSKKVESDELDGILEIGADVVAGHVPGQPRSDENSIRFQAKKPTEQAFMAWADQRLNAAIEIIRFAREKLDIAKVQNALQEVPIQFCALTKKNAEGKYVEASEKAQIAHFMLPAVLIGLMFMIIMVGATPAMQGVVEEKAQRIAEVLLGSVSPFELMTGKLIGLSGVSMTMAAIYLAGGYAIADRYGFAEMLSPELLVWFVVMMIMALFIFGSLFIAVGAAAGDAKDTQTLLMPIMVIACIPFFALGPIMQDPNGKVAVICSFFPFATPMLLVARQSVPPGVPLGQMIAGIALVLATTLFCVWAAGRIFRIGILMQGKGARFADMVRWIRQG